MQKKRDRLEIIADILTTIQKKGGKIKPTPLMYKSNLSHKQMNLYLDDLIQKNCIQKVKFNNYEYITITDNGNKFLQKIMEMKEFETTFGL